MLRGATPPTDRYLNQMIKTEVENVKTVIIFMLFKLRRTSCKHNQLPFHLFCPTRLLFCLNCNTDKGVFCICKVHSTRKRRIKKEKRCLLCLFILFLDLILTTQRLSFLCFFHYVKENGYIEMHKHICVSY